MFVSHVKLIVLAEYYGDEMPHIYFPVKTLNKVLFTYAFWIFISVFTWYQIFIFAAVFFCVLTLTYAYLMLRLWLVFKLSKLKGIAISVLMWPAVGVFAVAFRHLWVPLVGAVVRMIYSIF